PNANSSKNLFIGYYFFGFKTKVRIFFEKQPKNAPFRSTFHPSFFHTKGAKKRVKEARMVARIKKMVKKGCKLNIFYTFVFIAELATNQHGRNTTTMHPARGFRPSQAKNLNKTINRILLCSLTYCTAE
ncbi:MAG: hypothetical protein IIW89_03275, partial [Alistipes sp.]|nr:hypothetical protein [Alistipes sp.]